MESAIQIKKAADEKPCAYKLCRKMFRPTRPNKEYHLTRCRVYAYFLRQVEKQMGAA